MAVVNDYYYEDAFVKGRQVVDEYHYDPSCAYMYLFDRVIDGTSIGIKYLIRLCYCGHYTNKEKFLKRSYIYFSEHGDGVECHFSKRCLYKQPKTYKSGEERHFRKQCFCRPPNSSARR